MKLLVFVIILLSSLRSVSQNKWQPYGGLHMSMDGAGYYVGPSFQLGTDYTIKKREFTLSSYLHYFPERLDEKYSDGAFERGKYSSAIFALLIQKYYYKIEERSWFLAGGIALQRTRHDYVTSYSGEGHKKRTIGVAAIRFGYRLNAFALEINATGPHKEKYGPPYFEEVLEILTQLSLGVRFLL